MYIMNFHLSEWHFCLAGTSGLWFFFLPLFDIIQECRNEYLTIFCFSSCRIISWAFARSCSDSWFCLRYCSRSRSNSDILSSNCARWSSSWLSASIFFFSSSSLICWEASSFWRSSSSWWRFLASSSSACSNLKEETAENSSQWCHIHILMFFYWSFCFSHQIYEGLIRIRIKSALV